MLGAEPVASELSGGVEMGVPFGPYYSRPDIVVRSCFLAT